MSEPIKRFIETFIPGTTCNLKCHYCYLAQNNVSTHQKADFHFSREQMRKAITKERLGGACYFNLCADGETLLEPRTVEFMRDALELGHYTAVVTNGTLSARFKEIALWPKQLRENIFFIFSFHYLELQRLNLLSVFFDNVRLMRDSGCSFTITIVQCEEYIQHYSDIKELFMKELQLMPQIAKYRDDLSEGITIKTSRPVDEYFDIGIKEFHSALFQFEKETYQKNLRDHFCYAGDWQFYLNLCTGAMHACYSQPCFNNLFERPEEPLHFTAIGKHCRVPYCYNGSARLPFGLIPSYDFDYYWQYFDCVNSNGISSITDHMKSALSSKFYNLHKKYSPLKKLVINLKNS